jgi:hypothetical protein
MNLIMVTFNLIISLSLLEHSVGIIQLLASSLLIDFYPQNSQTINALANSLSSTLSFPNTLSQTALILFLLTCFVEYRFTKSMSICRSKSSSSAIELKRWTR